MGGSNPEQRSRSSIRAWTSRQQTYRGRASRSPSPTTRCRSTPAPCGSTSGAPSTRRRPAQPRPSSPAAGSRPETAGTTCCAATAPWSTCRMRTAPATTRCPPASPPRSCWRRPGRCAPACSSRGSLPPRPASASAPTSSACTCTPAWPTCASSTRSSSTRTPGVWSCRRSASICRWRSANGCAPRPEATAPPPTGASTGRAWRCCRTTTGATPCCATAGRSARARACRAGCRSQGRGRARRWRCATAGRSSRRDSR